MKTLAPERFGRKCQKKLTGQDYLLFLSEVRSQGTGGLSEHLGRQLQGGQQPVEDQQQQRLGK